MKSTMKIILLMASIGLSNAFAAYPNKDVNLIKFYKNGLRYSTLILRCTQANLDNSCTKFQMVTRWKVNKGEWSEDLNGKEFGVKILDNFTKYMHSNWPSYLWDRKRYIGLTHGTLILIRLTRGAALPLFPFLLGADLITAPFKFAYDLPHAIGLSSKKRRFKRRMKRLKKSGKMVPVKMYSDHNGRWVYRVFEDWLGHIRLRQHEGE